MQSREEFLAAITRKPVPFTSGGRSFFLLPAGADDMLAAQAWARESGKDKSEYYKFLFVRAVCDANGERLLTDEDTSLVGGFFGSVVDGAMKKILSSSGMGSEEPEEKKE